MDIPKTVIGKGWQAKQPADHVLGKNVPLAQVSRMYQSHNYVLNVVNRNNTRFGLNMRCFEVTACGAVLLTEDSPDIEKNYRPGEEVIVYRSSEDLKASLAQLQRDPEARIQLANNGYQRCMTDHCYHHRILTLLND